MIDVYVYIFLSQTLYQQKEKKGENWRKLENNHL
jgi:hypothetical protein